MTTRTVHIDINGINCANCSQTITDPHDNLDGVKLANVNFATNDGSTEYNSERVTQADILAAIVDTGYQTITEKVTVGIIGMTCSNCAATIRDAFETVPGVLDVDVNYAPDGARVTFNPAMTEVSHLYDTVAKQVASIPMMFARACSRRTKRTLSRPSRTKDARR